MGEEEVTEVIEEQPSSRKISLVGFILVVLVLGVISGWALFKSPFFKSTPKGEIQLAEGGTASRAKVGETYGREDDVFKDEAVGVVEANGLSGEGTHKLLREGGESQTVFLTSSILDLDMFIDRKVIVWGQTFSSEKVGWLMDVGRLKVVE